MLTIYKKTRTSINNLSISFSILIITKSIIKSDKEIAIKFIEFVNSIDNNDNVVTSNSISNILNISIASNLSIASNFSIVTIFSNILDIFIASSLSIASNFSIVSISSNILEFVISSFFDKFKFSKLKKFEKVNS